MFFAILSYLYPICYSILTYNMYDVWNALRRQQGVVSTNKSFYKILLSWLVLSNGYTFCQNHALREFERRGPSQSPVFPVLEQPLIWGWKEIFYSRKDWTKITRELTYQFQSQESPFDIYFFRISVKFLPIGCIYTVCSTPGWKSTCYPAPGSALSWAFSYQSRHFAQRMKWFH